MAKKKKCRRKLVPRPAWQTPQVQLPYRHPAWDAANGLPDYPGFTGVWTLMLAPPANCPLATGAGGVVINLFCPECGRVEHIPQVKDRYVIEWDGTVYPEFKCRGHSCGFHRPVKLAEWFGVRPHPDTPGSPEVPETPAPKEPPADNGD